MISLEESRSDRDLEACSFDSLRSVSPKAVIPSSAECFSLTDSQSDGERWRQELVLFYCLFFGRASQAGQETLTLNGHLSSFTNVVVDLGDRVVVTRPGFAELGHVGVTGWNRSLGGIVKLFRPESIQPLRDDHIFGDLRDARMAGPVINNRKERLPFVRAVAPVSFL